MNPPIETKFKDWRTFTMHVPGVLFTLSVGKTIEPDMKMTCFHGDPTHPIFVSEEITEKFKNQLGKHFSASWKKRGYLASKAKRDAEKVK